MVEACNKILIYHECEGRIEKKRAKDHRLVLVFSITRLVKEAKYE